MLKVESREVTQFYGMDVVKLVAEADEKYEDYKNDTEIGPRIYWVQKGERIFIPIGREEKAEIGETVSLQRCCELAAPSGGIRSAQMK